MHADAARRANRSTDASRRADRQDVLGRERLHGDSLQRDLVTGVRVRATEDVQRAVVGVAVHAGVIADERARVLRQDRDRSRNADADRSADPRTAGDHVEIGRVLRGDQHVATRCHLRSERIGRRVFADVRLRRRVQHVDRRRSRDRDKAGDTGPGRDRQDVFLAGRGHRHVAQRPHVRTVVDERRRVERRDGHVHSRSDRDITPQRHGRRDAHVVVIVAGRDRHILLTARAGLIVIELRVRIDVSARRDVHHVHRTADIHRD